MTHGGAGEFTLLLRGNLKDLARPGSAACGRETLRLPIRPGTCMRDYLADVGLVSELVMAVLVEGRSVGKEYRPAAGDEIVLLAPLSGG